jgi:hypothetical protein
LLAIRLAIAVWSENLRPIAGLADFSSSIREQANRE